MSTTNGFPGFTNAAVGGQGNLADEEIQRFAEHIYQFDSDKVYGTYELSELSKLPKSLFYDGATAKGVYQGLFAYYILGKNGKGPVKYQLSETTEYVQKITPTVSRNPTAANIIKPIYSK